MAVLPPAPPSSTPPVTVGPAGYVPGSGGGT
jgi:hypothetical protein